MQKKNELLQKATGSNSRFVQPLSEELFLGLENMVIIAAYPYHADYNSVKEILKVFAATPIQIDDIDTRTRYSNFINKTLYTKYGITIQRLLSPEFNRGLETLFYTAECLLHSGQVNAINIIKSFVNIPKPVVSKMPRAPYHHKATHAGQSRSKNGNAANGVFSHHQVTTNTNTTFVSVTNVMSHTQALTAAYAAANIIAGNAVAMNVNPNSAVLSSNGIKFSLSAAPTHNIGGSAEQGYFITGRKLLESIKSCRLGLKCDVLSCDYIHGEFEPTQDAFFRAQSLINPIRGITACFFDIKLHTEGASKCALSDCGFRHYTQIRPLNEIQKFAFKAFEDCRLNKSCLNDVFKIPVTPIHHLGPWIPAVGPQSSPLPNPAFVASTSLAPNPERNTSGQHSDLRPPQQIALVVAASAKPSTIANVVSTPTAPNPGRKALKKHSEVRAAQQALKIAAGASATPLTAAKAPENAKTSPKLNANAKPFALDGQPKPLVFSQKAESVVSVASMASMASSKPSVSAAIVSDDDPGDEVLVTVKKF